MFRVLIADDESSVIQSLKESVRWEELGLEVVCTASEGNEALRLACEKEIDIAILDIRMPGLNGLELCERLRRENEQIQLIIVSGYAEFAYAEKAIQYGVLGYCLKPLEYSQVTRFLRKALQNLKRIRHLSGWEDLMEILESGDKGEIGECLSHLGFCQDKYYVAVSVGERKLEELESGGISVRLGRGQWGYIMKSNRLGVLGNEIYRSEDWFGIGSMLHAVKAEEIYGSLEECIARAFQYFVDGDRKVYCHLDECRAGRWMESILQKTRCKQWECVYGMLKEIGQKGKEDFTVRSALRLCNLILSNLMTNDEENDYYIYSIEQLVNEYGSFSEMLEKLRALLDEARENKEGEALFTNAAFMRLIRYVNENYRGDISLTSAANALYMNANYVSQLFKKEAGVTFVHYITQKRLEDAKELLVTTKKPLTDIALEVGFNDTFHFIKTFKKFVGITPGQYRQQN